MRKLRHRGGELVDWIVTFTAAAYNLIRLRRLLAGASCRRRAFATMNRPPPADRRRQISSAVLSINSEDGVVSHYFSSLPVLLWQIRRCTLDLCLGRVLQVNCTTCIQRSRGYSLKPRCRRSKRIARDLGALEAGCRNRPRIGAEGKTDICSSGTSLAAVRDWSLS